MTEWHPIETAPKDAWIMITDGSCWPPDVVRWQNAKPKRVIHGNLHMGVPAGWFLCVGCRSRFDPLMLGHIMQAKVWCAMPALPKVKESAGLDQLVERHNAARKSRAGMPR